MCRSGRRDQSIKFRMNKTDKKKPLMIYRIYREHYEKEKIKAPLTAAPVALHPEHGTIRLQPRFSSAPPPGRCSPAPPKTALPSDASAPFFPVPPQSPYRSVCAQALHNHNRCLSFSVSSGLQAAYYHSRLSRYPVECDNRDLPRCVPLRPPQNH